MVIENPLLSSQPMSYFPKDELQRWFKSYYLINEPLTLFAFQETLDGFVEIRGILFALSPQPLTARRIEPGELDVFFEGRDEPVRRNDLLPMLCRFLCGAIALRGQHAFEYIKHMDKNLEGIINDFLFDNTINHFKYLAHGNRKALQDVLHHHSLSWLVLCIDDEIMLEFTEHVLFQTIEGIKTFAEVKKGKEIFLTQVNPYLPSFQGLKDIVYASQPGEYIFLSRLAHKEKLKIKKVKTVPTARVLEPDEVNKDKRAEFLRGHISQLFIELKLFERKGIMFAELEDETTPAIFWPLDEFRIRERDFEKLLRDNNPHFALFIEHLVTSNFLRDSTLIVNLNNPTINKMTSMPSENRYFKTLLSMIFVTTCALSFLPIELNMQQKFWQDIESFRKLTEDYGNLQKQKHELDAKNKKLDCRLDEKDREFTFLQKKLYQTHSQLDEAQIKFENMHKEYRKRLEDWINL